ncbi:MAG: flagellar hook capping FlgD N-terminal domain-containing protein [Pseudomonadota bacterium]
MTVSAVASATSDTAEGATLPQAAAEATQKEFTQFLELLTAQVENQDPLEPLDSTAFVEQLATFSALEQQVLTNNYLGEILTAVRGDGQDPK